MPPDPACHGMVWLAWRLGRIGSSAVLGGMHRRRFVGAWELVAPGQAGASDLSAASQRCNETIEVEGMVGAGGLPWG